MESHCCLLLLLHHPEIENVLFRFTVILFSDGNSFAVLQDAVRESLVAESHAASNLGVVPHTSIEVVIPRKVEGGSGSL